MWRPDGDLPWPGHAVVPGHEIVGHVGALGAGVAGLEVGQRVGVPWLGWTCGRCEHCLAGRENLCTGARFTGWQIAGGYAEQVLADARFVFALPTRYGDEEAAPLLCAGLIGWRAYAMAGAQAQRIGLYGFGAAAQIYFGKPLADLASRGARSSLSHGRAIRPRRTWREVWARPGPATRNRLRQSRWTPHCCSRPWARSCPRRCRPCGRAARWSAPAST